LSAARAQQERHGKFNPGSLCRIASRRLKASTARRDDGLFYERDHSTLSASAATLQPTSFRFSIAH